MIEADRKGLLEARDVAAKGRRRGGPLAVLMMLAGVWIVGRAALWENPFPAETLIDSAGGLFAERVDGPNSEGPLSFPIVRPGTAAANGAVLVVNLDRPRIGNATGNAIGSDQFGDYSAAGNMRSFGLGRARTAVSAGHYSLLRAALTDDPRSVAWRSARGGFSQGPRDRSGKGVSPVSPPFETYPKRNGKLDRWSLDAWAFWRDGSDAAPVSQGRVPVYGASQAGAILQYRFDPGSKRDPRGYVRAYRALIDRPETEIAAGVSARPTDALPVRVAAELRLTDNRFDRRIRPALYAVTEIPPVSLPFDLKAEMYGGAGYVAGNGDTLFADGHANVTRRVARFGPDGRDAVKVSVGAGAWGGAQRDASRVDVGPTVRFDLAVGDVPARFSIDWRERVAGDASPVSGLAATLSTSF